MNCDGRRQHTAARAKLIDVFPAGRVLPEEFLAQVFPAKARQPLCFDTTARYKCTLIFVRAEGRPEGILFFDGSVSVNYLEQDAGGRWQLVGKALADTICPEVRAALTQGEVALTTPGLPAVAIEGRVVPLSPNLEFNRCQSRGPSAP